MGGQSSSETKQQSTTAPWEPAQGALTGILGQLNSNLSNTGVTGAENGALNTLVGNANAASSTYAPMIANYAQNLLSGGGATDQAGNVNANYQRFVDQTNPLASNTNYNPYDTPGFRDAINTATADITNNTNGAFAAAGRHQSFPSCLSSVSCGKQQIRVARPGGTIADQVLASQRRHVKFR